MTHPKTVPGYTDLAALADAISEMEYRAVAELFAELARKFLADSRADNARGRTKLAAHLAVASDRCEWLEDRFETIWKICESHMNEET